MLLRILLAVLVACLSLPAMAVPACHAPEATTVEHHGHHAPTPDSDDRAQPTHVCIGCVPPATGMAVRATPLAPVALPVRLPADDMTEGSVNLPPLPPPRSFA